MIFYDAYQGSTLTIVKLFHFLMLLEKIVQSPDTSSLQGKKKETEDRSRLISI